MKTAALRIALALALLVAGCAEPSDKPAFTGKWTVTKENAISDQTSQETVDLTVKGRRFKLHAVSDDTDQVLVYDGKTLTTRTTPLRSMDGESPASMSTRASEKSDTEVAPQRFWAASYSGQAIAGGQICGRETLLYQTRDVRPDGEMAVQAWVDAETQVVLKRTFSIYSSQIEQLVSRSTEECRELSYGPVDDTVFARL